MPNIDNPHLSVKLTQASGMTPSIAEDTIATDNLSAMMKNAIVIFQSTLTLIDPPSQYQSEDGTAERAKDFDTSTKPQISEG